VILPTDRIEAKPKQPRPPKPPKEPKPEPKAEDPLLFNELEPATEESAPALEAPGVPGSGGGAASAGEATGAFAEGFVEGAALGLGIIALGVVSAPAAAIVGGVLATASARWPSRSLAKYGNHPSIWASWSHRFVRYSEGA
jgi:outer membrane biosynthesis protein TonB